MSVQFQQVMKDLSFELKSLFQADALAIVPGSGTAGMEAVVRALATDKDAVIVRNGWFSYRWTQILEATGVAKSSHVFKACLQEGENGQFVPADINEVTAYIKTHRPGVVFAPHVETASGMMLSDEYIRALAEAVHLVGGLLVIDCIASGCIWLDMKALGIDQIAAGTPLQVGEPSDYKSFRIGLFGLDKLTDIEGTVERFKHAADQVFV